MTTHINLWVSLFCLHSILLYCNELKISYSFIIWYLSVHLLFYILISFYHLFFGRVLRDSTTHFVSRSVGLSVHPLVRLLVGRSVCPSVTLYFFGFFRSLASLLLPKWWSVLKYGPCPPARDFGNRASGLVFLKLKTQCTGRRNFMGHYNF